MPEHYHPTRPTLDILTQPTERDKLDVAVRFGALIYLVLVEQTFQVYQSIERPVAQETLICVPVPQVVGRPRHCRRGRLIAAHGPREQSARVRDVVVRVGADDKTVEPLMGHAGWTGAQPEVENERGVRDERFVAAVASSARRPVDVPLS